MTWEEWTTYSLSGFWYCDFVIKACMIDGDKEAGEEAEVMIKVMTMVMY